MQLFLSDTPTRSYLFSDAQVRFVVGVYSNNRPYSSLECNIKRQENDKPAILLFLILSILINVGVFGSWIKRRTRRST